MEYFGIDISHYQGNVDFDKVAATKSFLWMKVSQGASYTDPMFATYYAAAHGKLPLGAYIYNKVTTVAEAKLEAERAVKSLKGKTFELGVWLDMEDKSMKSFGKTLLTNIIEAETTILKAAGFNVGIYCNVDWYNNVLDVAYLAKSFPLWIARYPKIDLGTYNSESKLSPKAYAVAWQYSSKGTVDGISGKVDMDVFFSDPTTLFAGAATETEENPYEEPTKLVLYKTRGDDAAWVQWQLNQFGYGLDVDGIFGNLSVAALKDFQSKHTDADGNALVVDGKCGAKTRYALKQV